MIKQKDMTKKPDLAQSLQKLITFTKHFFFFENLKIEASYSLL